MIAAWDDFMPMVLPYLKGAPVKMVEQALADSARDFLRMTHLWHIPMLDKVTEDGVGEYPVAGPSRPASVVDEIQWVVCENVTLTPTRPHLIRAALLDEKGRPRTFWLTPEQTLRLHPVPDNAYAISGMLILRTTRRSSGVPDWVFDAWGDPIASGAVWRLAMMPEQSWSNAQVAMYHKRQFLEGVANARVHKSVGVDLHVRPKVR